jgi:seryl-tRNA synthetase
MYKNNSSLNLPFVKFAFYTPKKKNTKQKKQMLDIKFIRENPDAVKANTANKNASADIDEILDLDKQRRDFIANADELKSKRNSASKEIGLIKKSGGDASSVMNGMKELSSSIKQLDENLRLVESEINEKTLKIPNMCDDSVPVGKSEDENELIKSWGKVEDSPHGLDHIAIAKKLGLFDFERGAKVTGAGFSFMTGKGARLERALINYFLDWHSDNGYSETIPPFIVNEDSMLGTGQLPKMADDMYHAQVDNLYLIPTAEVPLTNLHRDEILPDVELTKKLCGYSPCFRREAGSHGKDVRGFLRVHQFNKVELVKFSRPQDSEKELQSMLSDVEKLIQGLGLSYRILLLCSGDTSFASSITYDFEVWAESEKNWLEVSSCSNFKDFQARRANIRYRPKTDSKPIFVHTLNGSALATPRILVALIEKYFDGESLIIPEVLRKYTGFDRID